MPRLTGLWTLAALVALLAVLAVVQYHWIEQVTDAERQRVKANLASSLARLAGDFDAEVTRLQLAFQLFGPGSDAARLEDRLRQWHRLAPYPRLVSHVFLLQSDGTRLKLSPQGGAEPLADPPPELAALEERLRSPGPPGERMRGPGRGLSLGGAPALVMPMAGFPGMLFRWGGPRPPARPPERPADWVVVVMDAEYLRREFLPDLLHRAFGSQGESNYAVRVVEAGDPAAVVFQSDPAATPAAFQSPDATAPLFEFRPDCFVSIRRPPPPPGQLGFGGFRRFVSDPQDVAYLLTRKVSCTGPAEARPMPPGRWTIMVRHHAGSVGQAIATFRRRSLAISVAAFGILLVAITFLVISAERARALARLQMEFAAGVSHELRTPLTVIRVAAENLSDGIVDDPAQVRQYGKVLRGQAQQLSALVEQVLTFARSQSLESSCDLQPVAAGEMVERVLAACAPALDEAGMKVERSIQPGLPLVSADARLMGHCLENLVVNAIKYARSGGWLGVRVAASADREGPLVAIAIEDRGPGIPARELSHIFKPFYRGEEARSSQISGLGLGLSLVRRIVDAHHGTVTVRNGKDGGATFLITLRALAASDVPALT